MQLFTITTTKKSRVFSLITGGFIGAGFYYSFARTKIDSDRRTIRRTFQFMIPFISLEINVYMK
mgnify:CR=1 FL=1|tara:strand:+ start:405 stop:596 length:192 start_codon:yes stop_codon:yes gene_type:complete